VLATYAWVGARERFTLGAAIDSTPVQHSLWKQLRDPQCMRRWAPHTTRDTAKGVRKPSINKTELMYPVYSIASHMQLTRILPNSTWTLTIFSYLTENLGQRGPNTGTRVECGPQTVFVQPVKAFCVPYITQSHKYIILTTQPLQVTHHWSAVQYVTIRG